MSKRFLVCAVVLGIVAATVALPAQAAKKKKKKKVAPVETTLYLHGNESIGELESFSFIADAYLEMSTEDPAGDLKSKQLTNYVGGPNTECAGNTLFPVWVGQFSGEVKGDIKVSFPVVSTPGASVDVRIWPDVATLLCNSTATGAADYVEPAASAVVPLPAGQGVVEATLENPAGFEAVGTLMLQITPVRVPPFFGRVLYDVEDSKIELTCIPSSGKACA